MAASISAALAANVPIHDVSTDALWDEAALGTPDSSGLHMEGVYGGGTRTAEFTLAAIVSRITF